MVDLVLYDPDNHKITYNAALLNVGVFRKLIKKVYKTGDRDKVINTNILTYIFFKCDYRSSYLRYDEDKREKMILEACELPLDWKPDDIVKSCMDFYRDMQMTETMNFLFAAREAMASSEKTLELLRDVAEARMKEIIAKPRNEVTREDITEMVGTSKTIFQMIDDVPKRYDVIKNLEERIRTEVRLSRGKGGKIINKFEKKSSLVGMSDEKVVVQPDNQSKPQFVDLPDEDL